MLGLHLPIPWTFFCPALDGAAKFLLFTATLAEDLTSFSHLHPAAHRSSVKRLSKGRVAEY
jgi:hypothetical protein